MNAKNAMSLILLGLLACVLGLGCPILGQGRSLVTVVVYGDASSPGSKANVDQGDMKSLMVTVTEIALMREEQEVASEGEGEGEGEASGKVILFSGEKRIDVRDLMGISEIISAANVPAGTYGQIRLAVQDPELVLLSDPENPITDIQLTANGHLFVSGQFVIPSGQPSLVALDFQGLHLVVTGNGKYVWTPQLRADVKVTPANATVTGAISAVDTAAGTITVAVENSDTSVTVVVGAALVYLPTDTDTATGTAADLIVGAKLQVDGTLDLSGVLTAQSIHLLP